MVSGRGMREGMWVAITIQIIMSTSLCAQSSVPLNESPKQLLVRFFEMDANGKQLTQNGWDEMGKFFAQPGVRMPKEITIIKDYVVSDPIVHGNTAQLYYEYIEIEQLDSKLHFSDDHGFKPQARIP